jgi:ABC-type branched-subunit amino acid transport system ATPase component
MATEHILELTGLSKSFGGNRVITALDLAISRGGVTSLVGPNGAGKTTLFDLVTGFLTPDAGRVRLLGRDITGKPPHLVARAGIVRTFQSLRLFSSLTVLENVLLAADSEAGMRSSSERHESARVAMERAGVAGLADVRAADLSFAEQKFVSLARAIAKPAGLMLLDEPASGLDGPSLRRFHAIVRALVDEGRTVLLIEHNLDIVRQISDRVAFLNNGRLLAHGTPDEIFAMEELAALYFGDDAAT